jgi:hypothetical protein
MINLTRIAVVNLICIVAMTQMGCEFDGFSEPGINQTGGTSRQEIDFNFGWKFTKNPVTDGESMLLDDSQWRNIRLPHDWSIESAYTQENTSGATGYLPGGEGWYRKRFLTPVLADGQPAKTQVLFDGIYNHSEVWINGHSLGKRPSGYAPFYHDITPHLKTDGHDNVMAVYVDRTRYIDTRWYSGSGIYRNVKLIVTGQVHIPIWSTTIATAEVAHDQAKLVVESKVQNDAAQAYNLNMMTSILDDSGRTVTSNEVELRVEANKTKRFEQSLLLPNPQLWNVDSPKLYVAKIEIYKGEQLLDSTRTRFGVRTLKNDPNLGFFLNDRNLKIKGVNLHHDAGLVGSAVPKGVWERRLNQLKQAGVNAIRTGHHTASKEFLDLCDEMGFLVQEESFDEWDNPKDKRKNFSQKGEVEYITEGYSTDFAQWAERDLKAMLMRDKNHPSIFQWNIGNEIEWTYPKYFASTGYWKNNKIVSSMWEPPPITPQQSKILFESIETTGPKLADTAAKLAKWVREVDSTRAVIANLVTPSVSHYTGYADVLDVVGYSYRQGLYEYGHHHYPDKMIMGTENVPQWHEWKAVIDKPYIPGIFIWTGADYLGEANERWPVKGAPTGLLDFAGNTKPVYHMMKTLWSDQPHIYITTKELSDSIYRLDGDKVVEKKPGQWKKATWGWRDVNEHWNYSADELVVVEVYTNLEKVELFQNGESLGVQSLTENDDHVLKWAVPYQAGVLVAKSAVPETSLSYSVHTALETVAVSLTVDKQTLFADNYDVAHVTAQLVDSNGVAVKDENRTFTFTIDEKLRALGVDNGSAKNIQTHQSNIITSHKGRALLIVQSKALSGMANIKVSSDNLESDTIELFLTNQ